MRSQTKIFSQLVRDYMAPPAVVLGRQASVSELLGALGAAKRTSALVIDDDGRLAGIVTERDITRRVALRCEGGEAVESIMTAPVRSIGADDYLYFAIARMRRFGWRHMPVVDEEGRPEGIIGLNNALSVAGEAVLHRIELVSREGSLDGLREIKAAQVDLADELFEDNVPVPEIQSLLTHINRDIHRRIVEANLGSMADDGWGAPPVPFALIVMGSGGRGESFLYPDQDNGFILDDYPDSEHGAVDSFFVELAERMTRDLDAVGFPLCRGYVMATNPVWRKTRSQWRDQVRMWGRKRNTIAVQFSDIFFDFRCGYGPPEMVAELRRVVTDMVGSSPAFLGELHRESARADVALGFFGRLVTEKDKPDHRGEVNLKHMGTLPLVGSVRLLALREKIAETPTLRRIEILKERDVLSADEQDYLGGAFAHITHLLLRQQIADFKAGRAVGNYVHPRAMSERERDILVDSLKAIDHLRKRVTSEITGELF
jgi:signal-transduction protein with cAMP-binding, CBS, and nucleotidyltransferase domain